MFKNKIGFLIQVSQGMHDRITAITFYYTYRRLP